MNPKILRIPIANKNFTFDLPLEIIDKGGEMSEIYYNLFIFENFLRLFIEKVATNDLGVNFWDKMSINKKIKKKIKERKDNEKNKKWMSVRGDSDLFYTDLLDLKTIISSNWNIFRDLFPKEPWLTSKLEELYDLRNKVAHNSFLDRNEQQTVETYITNIYSQLGVELENVKFRELYYEQEDDMEEYYENDKLEIKIIDYEKINEYITMIDSGKIAHDMIRSALNSIFNEFNKITNETSINESNLEIVIKVCSVVNKFIKGKGDTLQRRALEALSPLENNELTKGILKKHCYETFKMMHKQGKSHLSLIRFLDLFGYFQNIEKILKNAIDNKETETLDSYRAVIDFSKFKNKRFELIKMLNEKLKTLTSDDNNLKQAILNIINKIV